MHGVLSAGCRGALGRGPSDGLASPINWGLGRPRVSHGAHGRSGVEPEAELSFRLATRSPLYGCLKKRFLSESSLKDSWLSADFRAGCSAAGQSDSQEVRSVVPAFDARTLKDVMERVPGNVPGPAGSRLTRPDTTAPGTCTPHRGGGRGTPSRWVGWGPAYAPSR